MDSNYNYVEYPYNQININYPKFYEDLSLRKWERVISEENVDDEECKEDITANMNGIIQANGHQME